MFNIGYVNLHREIQENVIWQSKPEIFKIYAALMMMVNFKPNTWEWQGQEYNLNPGQTITSIDSIVKAAGPGITAQNVRTALKKFEKYGLISNQSTKRGRLIILLNWNAEQASNKKLSGENIDGKFIQANSTRQLTKHQQSENPLNIGTPADAIKKLTNKLTVNQQTDNKQLTPIEEGNKDIRKAEASAANLQIINLYYKLFNDYTSDQPQVNIERESRILDNSGIMSDGLDNVSRKLESWFKNADVWTRDNRYPFGAFCKQYQSINLPVEDNLKYFGYCDICGIDYTYTRAEGRDNHTCKPEDIKRAEEIRAGHKGVD